MSSNLKKMRLEDCINDYTPIVRKLANLFLRKIPRHVHLEDLESDGMVGVLTAWHTFNDEYDFDTHCRANIWRSFQESRRDADFLKSSDRRWLRQAKLKPSLSDEQKRRLVGLDVQRNPFFDCDDATRMAPPWSKLQRLDLMRLVTKGLLKHERLIMIMYYWEDLTMQEIALQLDLSEARVSQIHSMIIQQLHHRLGKRRVEFCI